MLVLAWVAGMAAACSSGSRGSGLPAATNGPTSTRSPDLTTATTAGRLQPCSPSSLSVAAKVGSGQVGHEAVVVVFTNRGTEPCSMFGYPLAYFLGQGGRILSSAAVVAVGLPPSTVVLEPGGDAATTVWTANPEVPADCQQVTAAGVKVVLSGQTPSLFAKIAIPVCTVPTANTVGVTAVISGSTESAM